MSKSKSSSKNKMPSGLLTSEDESPTYTIHVLEDWCTDENDENKILITSRDFYHYNTSNNRSPHDIAII